MQLLGQNIEFLAKTSKPAVAADEAFRLMYTVNVEAPFTTPDLRDFKLLSGPSPSSYSQISIVNGQMRNTYTVTYTLLVRPKKEGEFTIPPASITYNNKVYKSNTLKVTVTKATGNGVPDNTPGQAETRNAGKNVFCSTSISKSKVYKGEPVLVTYKLYSRYTQIQDYDIKLSTQKDVWAQEISAGKQGWPAYEETVGGIRYMVYPIKKEVLFPQKTGEIKLEPFDMMVVARVNFYESQKFDLISNAPVLDVMPTPGNAPAGFTNAVGKFSIDARINKTEVNTNDGIDLTLKISGTGNNKLVKMPRFNFPSDFEAYDPEVNEKISVSANGMSGSTEYKYLIIPRHSGNYKIEPLNFTYFDLDTRNYVTLSTPEFNIKVNKVKGEEEPAAGLSGRQEVEILDKEIRYLKTYAPQQKESTFFTGSAVYFAGIAVPPVLFLLLLALRRRKQEQYDPVAERGKKANKQAVKQLQKARALLEQNNKEEFYTELLKGIQSYYSDRFNLTTVDFNRQRIHEVLLAKGVSGQTAGQFVALVDNCEMARYASFMHGNEQAMFADANAVINQVEQEVRS